MRYPWAGTQCGGEVQLASTARSFIDTDQVPAKLGRTLWVLKWLPVAVPPVHEDNVRRDNCAPDC